MSDADNPSLMRLQALMGRRLREGRLSLRLSEEEAARELAITISCLRSYEAGESRVPPRVLTAAAAMLRVDLDWFFKDDRIPSWRHPADDRTLIDFLAVPGAEELIAAFMAMDSSDNRSALIAFARMLAGMAPADRKT